MEWQPATQLEYPPGGEALYEPEALKGVQTWSELNHPIPPLPLDSCFQWIVSWYSWYLLAVTNRVGFQLARHWIPGRLLDSAFPLDAKVKQASSGVRETLHPASECVIVCDHSDVKMNVLLACFGAANYISFKTCTPPTTSSRIRSTLSKAQSFWL